MPLPKTMQALVLKNDGYAETPAGPGIANLDDLIRLKNIAVPTPNGREVLVKIGLALVNPSDLDYIKGEYGQPRRKGVPAGFEAMGEVVAAGDAEGKALIGRRVALLVMPPSPGVWADYATIDRTSIVPLAEGVRDADGASFIVNPLAAYAMVQIAKARSAAGIVMTAGGSQLCKLMASLARDEGMKVVVVMREEANRQTLLDLGASHVLITTAPDYPDALAIAMEEATPLVLLDAVGDQISANLFDAMPAGAEWVPYGILADEPPRLKNLGNFIFMGKSMKGFWLKQWLDSATPEQRAEASATVEKRFLSGAWWTDVAAEIPLADAPKMLAAALKDMKPGKIMLKP